MKIKWLGHACFLLTSSDGTRVLTDPFDESVGYKVPKTEADIVTTSHDHYDHNYVAAVQGEYVHFNTVGNFNEKGIEITGIASYHDKESGQQRGSNVVFVFTIDGLNICHLGDLGHLLNDAQIKEISPVDVLLIPVGGTYTIDYKEAAELVSLINPKLVIPMHYKTPALGFNIDEVDKFLDAMGSVDYARKQEIELNEDSFASLSKVIVLDYE